MPMARWTAALAAPRGPVVIADVWDNPGGGTAGILFWQFAEPWAGPSWSTLELGGQPYVPESPHDARLQGVAMIYQELNLALHLSAEANILLGAEPARGGRAALTARRAGAVRSDLPDEIGRAHV